MVSSSNERLNRYSIISSASSSSSKDSIDSQQSIILYELRFKSNLIDNNNEKNNREILSNEQSKEKMNYSRKFLFFGPLVLCIILLISGIIIFIIVGQQNKEKLKKTKDKNENQFSNGFDSTLDDNLTSISCPFAKPKFSIQSQFALNELKCGLYRSSLIHIYYVNQSRPINPGENLTKSDVMVTPAVALNFYFLSKLDYNSFILLFIDPVYLPTLFRTVVLYWIRYFSSSLEEAYDICHYRYAFIPHLFNQEKILLLYATDSSKMMIISKTICNRDAPDWFILTDYVKFNKLKLIGATHFFIPYVQTETESDED